MPRANDIRQARGALTASAVNHSIRTGRERKKPNDWGRKTIAREESWQSQAWDYYDNVGEFAFVANFIGNSMSKANLVIKQGGRVLTEGPAVEALKEFFGSPAEQKDALRMLGIQSVVCGHSFIVDDNGEWGTYTAKRISGSDKNWKLDNRDIPGATVIETWDPHPNTGKANSPARSAIGTLSEIHGFNMHINSQINSRLRSAGILFLPSQMTFATASSAEDGSADTTDADVFVDELMETMGTALSNPDSPEAVVPIVVTADAEFLDKPRLMTFWTEMDSHVMEMRRDAIQRLALDMDVPPEVLTGLGGSSHFAIWSTDSSTIKSHIEPRLNRVCRDLTYAYLWPALDGLVDNPKEFEIAADTSPLRTRPDRSKEAIELYNLGLVSAEVALRENGFNPEDDAMSKDDRKVWLTVKVATGSSTPSMMSDALGLLGVEGIEDDSTGGREDRPAPSLEDHPTQEIGDTPERKQDRERKREVEAASEMLVFRALERAGNKAKNQLQIKTPGVEAPELYLFHQIPGDKVPWLLEGSFDALTRFSEIPVDGKMLAATLERYTEGLIRGQVPYKRETLRKALEAVR